MAGTHVSKLRVAFLLAGQPRFVESQVAFRTHQKKVLDRYSVDVFAHMWWSPSDNAVYEVGQWSGLEWAAPSRDAPEIVRRLYHPVALEVDPPRSFALAADDARSLRARFAHKPAWDTGIHWPLTNAGLSVVISTLYSIERAVRLCEQAIASGSEYDLVLLARYDLFIHSLQDLDDFDPHRFYLSTLHPEFPDFLFIFGPQFLPSMHFHSRVGEVLDRIRLTGSEGYKEAVLLLDHSPDVFVQVPMKLSLVRSSKPDLERKSPPGVVPRGLRFLKRGLGHLKWRAGRMRARCRSRLRSPSRGAG